MNPHSKSSCPDPWGADPVAARAEQEEKHIAAGFQASGPSRQARAVAESTAGIPGRRRACPAAVGGAEISDDTKEFENDLRIGRGEVAEATGPFGRPELPSAESISKVAEMIATHMNLRQLPDDTDIEAKFESPVKLQGGATGRFDSEKPNQANFAVSADARVVRRGVNYPGGGVAKFSDEVAVRLRDASADEPVIPAWADGQGPAPGSQEGQLAASTVTAAQAFAAERNAAMEIGIMTPFDAREEVISQERLQAYTDERRAVLEALSPPALTRGQVFVAAVRKLLADVNHAVEAFREIRALAEKTIAFRPQVIASKLDPGIIRDHEATRHLAVAYTELENARFRLNSAYRGFLDALPLDHFKQEAESAAKDGIKLV